MIKTIFSKYQMTPEQTLIAAILSSAGFTALVGMIGRWLQAHSNIDESKAKVDTNLSLSDRQQIYVLLKEYMDKVDQAQASYVDEKVERARLASMVDSLKEKVSQQLVTITNNTAELSNLREKISQSSIEIMRLSAIIFWYKTQGEKQGIQFGDLPFELRPAGFTEQYTASIKDRDSSKTP